MTRTALVFALLLLSGCAVNSGVVNIGPERFLVSRQAATGFGGMGTLRIDAMKDGNKHCQSENKTMRVIEAHESPPPFILGNYPRIDLTFECY